MGPHLHKCKILIWELLPHLLILHFVLSFECTHTYIYIYIICIYYILNTYILSTRTPRLIYHSVVNCMCIKNILKMYIYIYKYAYLCVLLRVRSFHAIRFISTWFIPPIFTKSKNPYAQDCRWILPRPRSRSRRLFRRSRRGVGERDSL